MNGSAGLTTLNWESPAILSTETSTPLALLNVTVVSTEMSHARMTGKVTLGGVTPASGTMC